MVYAVESLSQKHDGYIPSWSDYHDDVKRKITPVLNQLDKEKSDLIKQTLIEGKQFRLRKRLETFVLDNLTHSYFKEYLGKNTNTMRGSFLKRCLNNLYQLRSSFVHELKPLDVMLSSPHSPSSDYIMRFGEPYFTYSGLNRTIREIIINFIKKNIIDKSEIIEWANETSSVVTAEISAECWIHSPDAFNGTKANKWFSQYIEMLNNKKITDQSKIMNKIENIFDCEKKIHKKALLHYYWLYNAIHNHSSNEWQTFINKRGNLVGGCIQFYIATLYLYHEFTVRTHENTSPIKYINLDEFDKLYEKYLKERFHKFGLSLSGYTEAGLLSAAANLALKLNDIERFNSYLDKALPEVANRRDKYTLIEKSIEKSIPVDMMEYFELKKNSEEK